MTVLYIYIYYSLQAKGTRELGSEENIRASERSTTEMWEMA